MQLSVQHSVGVSLRDAFPHATFFGDGDEIRVTSCTSDARSCQPGDLFVAIAGADDDGHAEVHEAVRRGAAAVLAERLLVAGVPVCVVEDTREAFGTICQALVGNPSRNLRVVGVTGTNGKTTVSMLLGAVFESAELPFGISTSLARGDGSQIKPAQCTTPDPPVLARLLARMAANGCGHAVMEVSSRALAERRPAGIELDAAVLTNLRRDHLDFHGSVLNYRRAKGRLFDLLKPEGFVVLNADDAASQSFQSQLDHPALTFGMRSPAEVTATVLERHLSEQTFLLSAGSESVPVRTRMIGDHHVYNCLAATSVALVMGLDLTTIARGLEAIERVPLRLERIECGQPFGVFVDAAKTPDRLAVALKTLRRVTEGRVICAFSADELTQRAHRPLLGRVAERHADVGILTSGEVHYEEPLKIVHDILDGYDRPARAHVIPGRANAIRWALQQAGPRDTVLIAGASEATNSFVGDGHDDRQFAMQWLRSEGAQAGCADSAPHQFTSILHVN